MSRFVLIPGAGGVAWYWSRVTPLLEAAGHEAIALDLPGDDENEGLHEYAERVVQAGAGSDDVILVGQSLGGFTVPLAAERTPVSALVFVNAMIPAPGETPSDWWGNVGSAEAMVAAARANGYSEVFDLETYFLHDVDPEIAAEGEAHQRNETDAAFQTVCDFSAWPAVKTRVLAGADDRFFPVDFQRRVARDRLGVDADTLPGGHLMSLSNPTGVADYLTSAARW